MLTFVCSDSIYTDYLLREQSSLLNVSSSWRGGSKSCTFWPNYLPTQISIFRDHFTVNRPLTCLCHHSEDEVQENESEFSHLRLQLRAVEASCLEYLPQDADQDLLQSIENWKKDWASLKKRMADRHHRPHGDGHSFSGDVTVTSLGSAGH